MAVYNQEFKVASQAGQVSYVDITETVKNAVATSGVQSGIVTIVTAHTTCAILYEEYTHDVDEHQVAVGRTGYFYLADFDQTRERVRKYRIVVIGE